MVTVQTRLDQGAVKYMYYVDLRTWLNMTHFRVVTALQLVQAEARVK